MMRGFQLFLAATATACLAVSAAAQVVPRNQPPAGSVIARKSGEEIRFIDLTAWQTVDLAQDLLAGDVLRTNAMGQLAVLFADRTQMRLGRNTTLRVKEIGAASDSLFALQAGSIWGRAQRGGIGLTVETPAAAAAIRGTDWTLKVAADGATTLAVLKGTVELSNALGSVTVSQGEGAFAAIGQAPTKIILVDLAEREQILLYGELRSAFADLPVAPATGPALRSMRDSIAALPEAERRPEDWLALAEARLSLEGRQAALEALSHLRRPLPRLLEARARLVEAMIAGQERHYVEAGELFRAALPDLKPGRRATAAYGAWFAEALSDPDRQAPTPQAGAYADDPAAALARATAAAYVLGQAEAIEILRQAEARFPADARLPAMRADLAFQLDRREEVEEALAKARAIDPDDPWTLLVSARYRATVESDLDGALAELDRAVQIAPGADAVWNEIGIVQASRNAVLEADAAHRRAIVLNPENPVLHANYARFLLAQDQLDAAKRALDAAEALDSNSYAVLAAKGRYLMRIGRTEEAEQALLEASAVNPAYAEALIGLAIAGYQLEDADGTGQALDNADRLDVDDPSIPLIRTAIALDEYRVGDAIANAREALRRRMARGGYYSGYDANRQTSSYLGIALNFLELDEWGRFYADKAYDPFVGTSYLDEAAAGRVTPFLGSELLVPADGRTQPGSSTFASQFQGVLLDPLGIASRSRRNDLERRPFAEATLGGGLISESGEAGWQSEAVLQGLSIEPIPVSWYARGHIARPEGPRDNDHLDVTDGDFAIGLRPTLADNIVLFGNTIDLDRGYPGYDDPLLDFGLDDTRISNLGAGWSHTLGERNLLQSFIVGSRTGSDLFVDDGFSPTVFAQRFEQDSITFGSAHLYGVDDFTFRHGVEASLFRSNSEVSEFLFGTDTLVSFIESDDHGAAVKAWSDVTWDPAHHLSFSAGIYPTWFDDASTRVNPRLGIAWAASERHWLRAFYREDTQFPSNYTLSPISTHGLTPLEAPLFPGGNSRTTGLRWDAEWTERFFTSLEYQHQRLNGLALSIPDVSETFGTSRGTIDRFSASANYWIGGGLGAFATFAWHQTEDRTPGGSGLSDGLPLVPQYIGRVGISFVHPSKLKITLAQTFVGERPGIAVVGPLDSYTTTDASLKWVSPSGHLEADLQLLNAFDNDFELATGVPGPGRTIFGSIKARF